MPERVNAMCEHLFERLLATGDRDPLQKTIIFCASDHHADLVTNQMNNLYATWCREHKQKRVQTYAFKCMSSQNGQALIPDFRGRAALPHHCDDERLAYDRRECSVRAQHRFLPLCPFADSVPSNGRAWDADR